MLMLMRMRMLMAGWLAVTWSSSLMLLTKGGGDWARPATSMTGRRVSEGGRSGLQPVVSCSCSCSCSCSHGAMHFIIGCEVVERDGMPQ